MKKLFTLAAAMLTALTMSAESVTMDLVLAKGSTPAPSIGVALMSGGAFDGTGYKMGSDGNYIGWNIAAAGKTFEAVTFNGYYNTNNVKNWGFQFSTDGGTTWGTEVTQEGEANNKAYHDIAVTVDIPTGANAIRIIRRAGTSAFVASITLTLADDTPTPVTAAEISGETACALGNSIELTCTAAKATTYQWSMNGVEIDGATAKKYTFTPTAEGSYSFTCAASNQYNTDPVVATAHVVAVTDPAKAYGEIIKATLTSGTAATVSGEIGGTADVNLSSSKKLDSGKHLGITLAAGNFKEGDTVVVELSTASQGIPCLFAGKDTTNILYLAEAATSETTIKIVLPAAASATNSIYLIRSPKGGQFSWNPTMVSLSVVRPMPIKSNVEELTAVKVNGTAISAADLNDLKNDHSVNLDGQYAKAPVVTYTKHVVITYEDNTQKIEDVDIEVTAEFVEANNNWEAVARINEINYKVLMQKAASHTVTYKYGEETLGTEIVGQGEHPEEYAQYQTMQLATFGGWYREAELDEEVAYMEDENITEDVTFYAKFTKVYAQSVNIEQKVLDEGTKYDMMAYLGGIGYASNIENSLDSLNDEKTARNEPYLGLKVKAAGKLLNFRVAAGEYAKVKFGNVGKTPLVSINGSDYAAMEITEGVYTYTATADALVSIKTADGSTVVFKQIMINEEIKPVTLPDSPTTGINNTEAEIKAVKMIKNGQLLIEKNGKVYNAQGAVVK